MIVKKKLEPFPYLMVKNLYSHDEQDQLFAEIQQLQLDGKFEPGFKSNPYIDLHGAYLKECDAVYLDAVFGPNRMNSKILTITRKVLGTEILSAFAEMCFGYQAVWATNLDTTMLSAYGSGHHYKKHHDVASFTALTWLFKEPKKFTGGNLKFSDSGHVVNVESNMMVMFPSFVFHEVDKIVMQPGAGFMDRRFCLTNFMLTVPKF